MHPMHSDVVGSLLRPAFLLEARAAHRRGELDDAGLRKAEDRAVDEAVAVQTGAGVAVVTDGEYRRASFYAHLLGAVEGFAFLPAETTAAEALPWQGGDGRPQPQTPVRADVTGKLRRKAPIAADEFRYLKTRVTGAVPKATLPAPSFMARYWVEARSSGAYATRDAYLADLVQVLREEVADLVAAGATYIQFDGPNYALLVDPKAQALFGDVSRILPAWAAVDNAVIEGFSNVTFGLHMCRGNMAGMWAAQGGYEPVAAAFGLLGHERLLLEYDTDRSGTFAPLRHVPDGKTVVLGLVSTKSGDAETVGAVTGRIRDAARTVPLERLAVSPQCGFASVEQGNPLTPEEQADKLRVVAQAAAAVWG
jgi:5-methyltetrahydropteroyltriglutamate--homocysteine methyltransferase